MSENRPRGLRPLLLPLMALVTYLPAHAQQFVHPGLLSTDADFARMKFEVDAGAHPWTDSYKILMANSHASLNYEDHPADTLVCGSDDGTDNTGQLYNDIAAAYADSLVWKISGNTSYADKAVKICDDWSAQLTTISGGSNASDVDVAAGIYGYEFANVAENMRSYKDWGSSPDFARFQNMMMTAFYSVSHDYLLNHNNLCQDADYPSWDELSYASILAIGVLCDNHALYNEAVSAYKSTTLCGGLPNSVYQVFPGLLGQLQESGSDQDHSSLTLGLLGAVGQMAWNQGDDLFSFDNNRLLSGAEYYAKYNLKNSVPFANYENCQGVVQSNVSSTSRGKILPIWALIYNHYANIEGIAAPYSKQYIALTGSEGGGGNYGDDSSGYDLLGYTTLTCTVPDYTGNPAPTGLKTWVNGSSVTLGWWGSPTATSYNIGRSTVHGGPYMSLASGVTSTSYTDSTVVPGVTFYYVASSVNSNGVSPYSAEVAATPNAQLTGALIGTPGSNGDRGNTAANAFDGCSNAANWFDAPDPSGDWVGLDLGPDYKYVPNSVSFCPRAGHSSRMVGGTFQGSNTADFSAGVTTLFTITNQPPDGAFTTASFNNNLPLRYVRYVGPDDGYCNVSEIQFFGDPIPDGAYRIVNKSSGLDLNASGTKVDQQPDASASADQWMISSIGNGQYKFTEAQGGKVLEVAGGSILSAATVDLGEYDNLPSQHFALIPTEGGYFRISPLHSAKAIEVRGAATSTGAAIDQGMWTADASQQWRLLAP